MISKTRIALAVAIVLGSASAVLAESHDFNPRERDPNAVVVQPAPIRQGMIQTAPTTGERAQFGWASRTVDGGF